MRGMLGVAVLWLGLVPLVWTLGAVSAMAKEAGLRCVIKKIDTQVGNLSVLPYSSDKVREYSLIGPDLPVTDAAGQPARLTDLKPGSRVVLKLADSMDVIAIQLDGPALWGTVRSVQGRNLFIRGEVREEKLIVPEKAAVQLDKQPAQLSDLKPGVAVRILFTPDHQSIVQVQAGKGVESKDPSRKLTRHSAVLLEVDHANRMVECMSIATSEPITREKFTVAPNAPVRLLYHLRHVREGRFEELRGLLRVVYTLNEETRALEAIEAELPVLGRRKVLSVDFAAGKLIVEEARQPRELKMNREVRIILPTGMGQPNHVVPGKIVNVGTTLDRSEVMLLYVWDK